MIVVPPEFFYQASLVGQKNCLNTKNLIFADVTAKNMSASGASEHTATAEAAVAIARPGVISRICNEIRGKLLQAYLPFEDNMVAFNALLWERNFLKN